MVKLDLRNVMLSENPSCKMYNVILVLEKKMVSYFPQYHILGGIMFSYKISLKDLHQASIRGAFWGLGWYLERPELYMACFSW